MKLYEMPIWWLELEQQAELAGEELPPDLEARMDALDAELQDKVQAACCVVRTFQADAAQARGEAERLLGLATVRERQADRLKDYMLRTLQAMDIRQVKTPLFSVSVCENSQFSLSWSDPDTLPPPEWCSTVVSPDFAKVRESMREGNAPPAGFTYHRGKHLRIR